MTISCVHCTIFYNTFAKNFIRKSWKINIFYYKFVYKINKQIHPPCIRELQAYYCEAVNAFSDRNSISIYALPFSALLHYLQLKYAKSFSILKLRQMEVNYTLHNTDTGYFKRNQSPTHTLLTSYPCSPYILKQGRRENFPRLFLTK